jgi:hypothetical protein
MPTGRWACARCGTPNVGTVGSCASCGLLRGSVVGQFLLGGPGEQSQFMSQPDVIAGQIAGCGR